MLQASTGDDWRTPLHEQFSCDAPCWSAAAFTTEDLNEANCCNRLLDDNLVDDASSLPGLKRELNSFTCDDQFLVSHVDNHPYVRQQADLGLEDPERCSDKLGLQGQDISATLPLQGPHESWFNK